MRASLWNVVRPLVLWFVVAVVLFGTSFYFFVGAPYFWAWSTLGALNASTFLLYGFDKCCALIKCWRVPEKALWIAAFLGGSLGALFGVFVFRHKVSKPSFMLVLAVLILVQMGIVISVSSQ
jgi:uncharacterized membrane protein YsdA (DUF1294 family)